MYLMNYTRPDIVYTIRKLSRYTSNLNGAYWSALLRVVGYVSNTKKYALRYEKYPPFLKGTVMQIGLQILRNQIKPADTITLEAQWYFENISNKHTLPDPKWDQNL